MLRKLLFVTGALVVLVVAFVGSIFLVSEIAGEVVTVHTAEPDGGTRSTRLWIVDDDGYAWLRAGLGRVPWVDQAAAAGHLTMLRNEEEARYRVVLLDDPETRDRVHALMREKYGLFDGYIDLIRDGSGSTAVRLERVDE
jgi:hypothetical protein